MSENDGIRAHTEKNPISVSLTYLFWTLVFTYVTTYLIVSPNISFGNVFMLILPTLSFIVVLGFYKRWRWVRWLAYVSALSVTGAFLYAIVHISVFFGAMRLGFPGIIVIGVCFMYLSSLRSEKTKTYFGVVDEKSIEHVFGSTSKESFH